MTGQMVYDTQEVPETARVQAETCLTGGILCCAN